MGVKFPPHFPLEELVFSETAIRLRIDNTPSESVLANLALTASRMEVVRKILRDKPISITSGFRCLKLNKVKGGASTSAHVHGLAVDFQCHGFGSPREICKELLHYQHQLEWDQLIYEGGWVHLGWTLGENRGQILTADFSQEPTAYLKGIV